MAASPTLATAFRMLLLGALLSGFLLKPMLAFAEEVHELVAHSLVAHPAGADDSAPAPGDGQTGHDGDHWHLSHCCGNQAAVAPRLYIDLPAAASASPIPALSVAFAPTPLAAPFRPPIRA